MMKRIFILCMSMLTIPVMAQVRYTGKTLSNPNRHDGGLSPVVGVHNIQPRTSFGRERKWMDV